MTVAAEGTPQGAPTAEVEGLNAAEQAAVAVGQRGLSEAPNADVKPELHQRPEGVPEKFWDGATGKVNTEALLKSYSELEKSRGAPKEEPAVTPEAPAAPARQDGKVEVKPEGEAEAATPLASAIEASRNEWAETGELSEDTFKSLEEAGLPREIVNLYLEGVKAQTAALLTSIHEYVGGEENYSKMTAWAGSVMTEAEANAFNAALDNPDLRENAVRGLYARYTATQPNEGNLVTTNGNVSVSGEVFRDRNELIAAQKDPRYQTDARYRQDVAEKLQRSQATGSMGRVVESGLFARKIISN